MATAINSPQDMATFLNQYQDTLSSLDNYDPLGGTTVDKFAQEKLGMTFDAPDLPNYQQTFKDLREELNLSELEGNMNMYKDLIRKEEVMMQQQRNYLREQPVRMGVIEGRTDKATRDRQEQISWYSSELQRAGDMVTSAYNMINMTMQFKQMDYEAAREQYATEINQRLAVYEVLSQESRDKRDFAYKVAYDNRAHASSQLSMYAGWITEGNMSWDTMDVGTKAEIAKLETMAGLPVGMLGKLQLPAGHDVVQMIPRDDGRGGNWLDIVYRNPDGSLRVENVRTGNYTPTAPKSSASETATAEKSSLQATLGDWLKTVKGTNYVSPKNYNAARGRWTGAGYDGKAFDDEFNNYVNPTHYWNIEDKVWTTEKDGSKAENYSLDKRVKIERR